MREAELASRRHRSKSRGAPESLQAQANDSQVLIEDLIENLDSRSDSSSSEGTGDARAIRMESKGFPFRPPPYPHPPLRPLRQPSKERARLDSLARSQANPINITIHNYRNKDSKKTSSAEVDHASPPAEFQTPASQEVPRPALYPEMDLHASPNPHAIHIDPLAPEDQIVCMSLQVSDDLEDELEEFSKLRRLGRFTDAFRLFDNRLSHFLHNKYIRVQYGQCLFEAGELRRLAKLVEKWELKCDSSSTDALDLLWMFLAWETEAETLQLWERVPFLEVALYMTREKWPSLDSTEVAVLGYLCREKLVFSKDLFESGDWDNLCEHLVEEGMIWEFRDVVQWMAEIYDGSELKEEYICQRWLADDGRLENQDDSTLLALLDVLATLSLIYMKKKEKKVKAETCFQLAHRYALELVTREETYAKSQPYLRWIMANVIREDPEGSHSRDQITLDQPAISSILISSMAVFPSFFPTIFVPMEDETAAWAPKSNRAIGGLDETVRMVLRAAEDLGDQRFRAGCLIELMYRGAESPEGMAGVLIGHWAATGDVKRKKMMHLFRYMLANTDSARERLRLDILADGPFHDSPVFQSRQYRTLRALSIGDVDKNRYDRHIYGELESGDELDKMLSNLSGAFSRGKNPEKSHKVDAYCGEPSMEMTDYVAIHNEEANRHQLQLEEQQAEGGADSITRDYEQRLADIQVLRKKLKDEADIMRRARESLQFEVRENLIARENLKLEKEKMDFALRQVELPEAGGGAGDDTTAHPPPDQNHEDLQVLTLAKPTPSREGAAAGTPSPRIVAKKREASHAPGADDSGADIGAEEGDRSSRYHGPISTARTEELRAAAHDKQESQKVELKQVEVESVSDLEDAKSTRDGNDGTGKEDGYEGGEGSNDAVLGPGRSQNNDVENESGQSSRRSTISLDESWVRGRKE